MDKSYINVKKWKFYLMIGLVCLLLGIFFMAGVCQTVKLSTQTKLIYALGGIELGSDIKLLETRFGKPLYTTTSSKGDKREWYKMQFSVTLQKGEECYVFHPPGSWPNQLVVVITDKNGKIKWATPRET